MISYVPLICLLSRLVVCMYNAWYSNRLEIEQEAMKHIPINSNSLFNHPRVSLYFKYNLGDLQNNQNWLSLRN